MKEKRNIKSLKVRREIGQCKAMVKRWLAWNLKQRLGKAEKIITKILHNPPKTTQDQS